jgi:hypothetical protein
MRNLLVLPIFIAFVPFSYKQSASSSQLEASSFISSPSQLAAGSFPTPPSKEAFLNAVAHYFVDSGFTHYYLSAEARPCSFVKYEYDDWVKYGMMEDVNIQVLNELAKKCYFDRNPRPWREDSLANGCCVDARQVDSVLDPLMGWRADSTRSVHYRKRITRKKHRQWLNRKPEGRAVFYFSLPEFTDDGQYAVMDLEFRCDNRQCGLGATWVFRLSPQGWIPVCKKTRWSSSG